MTTARLMPTQVAFAPLVNRTLTPQKPGFCPFCSFASWTAAPRPRKRLFNHQPRRSASTSAPVTPRQELEKALVELQHHHPSLVNPSRLQLALQALTQRPGEETLRIAVLALGDGTAAKLAAKNVLRLLLADPLADEAEWERELEGHDLTQPLLVRVGERSGSSYGTVTFTQSDQIPEVYVSSPQYNGLRLELLLMSALPSADVTSSPLGVEEAFLVPSIGVPAQAGSSITTNPVHKSIVVASALSGAIEASRIQFTDTETSVLAVVDIPGFSAEMQADARFRVVDLEKGIEAVQRIRQGPQHGIEYERLWYASGLPAVVDWLRSSATREPGLTKYAVRDLIAALLRGAEASIQAQAAQELSHVFPAADVIETTKPLVHDLGIWAEQAHAELRDELDLAFRSQRWRKLGWWKLFWRVDDVAMLTNELISKHFLPMAERDLVYLSGRIAQSRHGQQQYEQPSSTVTADAGASRGQVNSDVTSSPPSPILDVAKTSRWPGHIAFTRRYLQGETIPALQALAQKLVFQSMGTTAVTTALSSLFYISSIASTLPEALSVAALGLVYSLLRMQNKWESARTFWEGEAREEGRKAVRAAEEAVADVLRGSGRPAAAEVERAGSERQAARELVARAVDALARMK